jgi:hypothetical protein
VGELGPALLADLQSYKGPVYAQGLGLHSDDDRACGCLVKKVKAASSTTSVDRSANGTVPSSTPTTSKPSSSGPRIGGGFSAWFSVTVLLFIIQL